MFHSRTQEAQIFKHTNIKESLVEDFYPIDKYTEDITVYEESRFRYDTLALLHTRDVKFRPINRMNNGVDFTCDVVSIAAIAYPGLEKTRMIGLPNGSVYTSYEYAYEREITRRKINLLLSFCVKGGYTLIAGAWGCGAFGNPDEIYQIWREEIKATSTTVVFPIIDNFARVEYLLHREISV
jgi:hypothetical protein